MRRGGTAFRAIVAAAVASIVPACGRAADLEAVRAFEAANRALADAGSPDEFAQAAARFEEALALSGENGAVLHGLGNAWWSAGERGRAIAAWRRARVHRPRDPFLRANLETALGRDPDEDGGSPLASILFWRDELSEGEQAWLLTGCVALACAFFGLARLAPRGRAVARTSWRALAVLSAPAAIGFALTVHEHELTEHGVVVAAEVNARKGPARSFEPAFSDPLVDGTELIVLERRDDWLRVRVGSELEGWLPADEVVVR